VMSKMFQVDNTDADCGSVRWFQLVQALTDAGFSVIAAGGSAVSFSNDAGSIVFDKPHPDPSIDAMTLRAMGKRLCKWFNWRKDRFQVRPKDSQA